MADGGNSSEETDESDNSSPERQISPLALRDDFCLGFTNAGTRWSRGLQTIFEDPSSAATILFRLTTDALRQAVSAIQGKDLGGRLDSEVIDLALSEGLIRKKEGNLIHAMKKVIQNEHRIERMNAERRHETIRALSILHHQVVRRVHAALADRLRGSS